jgi:hypothetical protein
MDSSDKLPKHLLIGFLIALLVYAGSFAVDQHLRNRKGPWTVRFSTNENGWAQIEVTHPKLGVEERVIFFGERPTNTGVVSFDRPSKPVPFGKVKFEDLTYLPGSVAFDFFGHEVELLPRTLYLNKREQPWTRGATQVLKPEEKLPPGASFDPRKKKRQVR